MPTVATAIKITSIFCQSDLFVHNPTNNKRSNQVKRRNIKVYPAGPIQGSTIAHTLANMEAGNMWTARLFQLGFSPFPVFSDEGFIRKVRPIPGITDIYNYSLEWLKVADAMLLIEGWEKSTGAQQEVAFAERHGVPVFYDVVDLCAWADMRAAKHMELENAYIEEQLRKGDD